MSERMLDGPRLAAAGGAADRLIILCHGYGADGQDLIGLAGAWQRLMPRAAFAAPNGPERCAGQPLGYQWFALPHGGGGAGRDPAIMRSGVARAAAALERFIEAELARHGLAANRLALVGFSQGTMTALQAGLCGRARPAAIIGFSGALAAGPDFGAQLAARPPILLVHGDADPMIPLEAMYDAAQRLGAEGLQVLWHVSAGVGHGIAPDGMELAGEFLVRAFARGG